MAQSPLNGITQPVDSEEEGRSPTTDRQWVIKQFCEMRCISFLSKLKSYYSILRRTNLLHSRVTIFSAITFASETYCIRGPFLQIQEYLLELEEKFPELCEVEQLGVTHEGRAIRIIRVMIFLYCLHADWSASSVHSAERPVSIVMVEGIAG